MIEFIGAVYNEETQISGLINHLESYVDKFHFVDDGSIDTTSDALEFHQSLSPKIEWETIVHTGLPETVKALALTRCDPDSWVIMLDADERFAPGVLDQIRDFISSPESLDVDHVYFNLDEFIDGQYAGRTFLKCRLFRAWAGHFSDQVHVSDWFDGKAANYGWKVLHKKTREKQITREREYCRTYQKLFEEGKITKERVKELISYHYFIK